MYLSLVGMGSVRDLLGMKVYEIRHMKAIAQADDFRKLRQNLWYQPTD